MFASKKTSVKSKDVRHSPISRALAFHLQGDLTTAQHLYLEILRENPAIFDSLHILGVTALQTGDLLNARYLLRAALCIQDQNADCYCSLGNVFLALKQYLAAEHSFRQALLFAPLHQEAANNLGNALKAQGKLDEAMQCYQQVIRHYPQFGIAHNNLGNVYHDMGLLDEAIDEYQKALALDPVYPEAHYNLARTFQRGRQYLLAVEGYICAIEARTNYWLAYQNLGSCLFELRQYSSALECYDKVLEGKPDYAMAYVNRGKIYRELKLYPAALDSLRHALELNYKQPEALENLGDLLVELGRYKEAVHCYQLLLVVQPNNLNVLGKLFDCALHNCDWVQTEELHLHILEKVALGNIVVAPDSFLCADDSKKLQLRCAQEYVKQYMPSPPESFRRANRAQSEKIRLAYLSSNFYQTSTESLIAELIMLHDRNQFEVLGISLAVQEDTPTYTRMKALFDQFFDVATICDDHAAKFIADLEIDIAVDLMGFAKRARPFILAARPALVQVAFMGYPGTSGMPYIDYILGDSVVTPFADQVQYSERIVQMPSCYLPSNFRRQFVTLPVLRNEIGLPSTGFVYCCFNHHRKISKKIFVCWMRILKRTANSVLWLLECPKVVRQNLCVTAKNCGIDPDRLVFAPYLPTPEHLARHNLADLFLDTPTYNAIATASDALWMGLPILTCKGETFSSRIGASLLQSVGIPELIVDDLGAYEALACELAIDRQRLSDFKIRLKASREKCALFDTRQFCMHLENAYIEMVDRIGRPLEGFSVV